MSNFALQLARRIDPRHLAFALIAVIVAFAGLDYIYSHKLDSLVAFHLDDSDPATRNSFPAVIIGVLLLWAGFLAFAVARMRDTDNPTWFRAAGIVLIVFGIDEAIGLHTWFHRHLDVTWNVAYLPFITIAAVVWFEAVRQMRDRRDAQLLFLFGTLGWLLAAVFDAARTDRIEAYAGGELLEMAAAGVLLLGMFSFARARSLADRPLTESSRQSAVAIAQAAVSRIDLRALVIGLASLAVAFGILGAIVYPGGGDLRAFDLNKEQTFPATFSGLLLLAAGGLALLNGLVRGTGSARRWWIVLALVFAFLGLDEIAALHEAVQDRVHVWGQAVLTPIVLVGIYAWWRVLKTLWNEQPAGAVFLMGAVSWIVSQGIDAVLNEHWGWTIVPEELCEMLGSALFGFALLIALRKLLAAEPAPAVEPARAVETAPHPAPVGAR